MLRLEMVKSPSEELVLGEGTGLNRELSVTLLLISPCTNTNRMVCAESYFASDQTAKVLQDSSKRFIAIVKMVKNDIYLGV